MKNLIMFFTLSVLILSIGSKVQAGITYVDVVDASDGQSDTYFGEFRWYDSDWGWTHTFNPPELVTPGVIINSASLSIYAYDVDYGQIDLVEGDGLPLGQLEGAANNTWHLTTLTLDAAALDELLDGSMDIWVNIGYIPDEGAGPYWGVTIASSTLTVDYDEIVPDQPTDVIPAPGAILLGSIGVGVVSWLRRRRTL